MKHINVKLSTAEIALLEEALDSHEYWQLADPSQRSSGYVLGSGSEDSETAREIRRARRLAEKLHAAAS